MLPCRNQYKFQSLALISINTYSFLLSCVLKMLQYVHWPPIVSYAEALFAFVRTEYLGVNLSARTY